MIILITTISERMDRKTLLHKTLVQCDKCMRLKILANIVTDLSNEYCWWCDKCRRCKKSRMDGDHYWGMGILTGQHEFTQERRGK